MSLSQEILVVSLVLVITERASGAVEPGYLGCFNASRNEIKLTGHQATVRTMMLKACNALCFSLGFTHAATKDGKECYCDDLSDSLPEPDAESLCNIKCFSDMTAICGGKNAYSLYTTGIKEDDIDNLDDLEIGCIGDNDDTRLIPEHKVDFTLNNTPKRCIAYCRALGYPHAGVQYSLECYCGLSRRTGPSVDGCDLPCTGDPSLSCGGHWRANVYSTGITKPPPGVSTRGCYHFNRTLFVSRKTIAELNPNKCASRCYFMGYAVAFLHEGFECLCGKKLPPSRFKAPPGKCDIPCESDSKSKCGGIDSMTAYTTGVVGNPLLGRLVGCYKDENNDLLSGPKLNLGAENGIAHCISRCIELGYAFAGLRNTFECQCSQTSPKRTPVKIVPDYECSSPCPGPKLEMCGAPLFTAIHRTGVTPSTEKDCVSSVSRVNGKKSCGGETLFLDKFDDLNTDKWEHTVRISGDDAEFVTYTKKRKNIFVENGRLIIRPTIINDKFIKYGRLDLKGCTGQPNSIECQSAAKSYHILPPIESGQICTRKSFNFRYGVVTVGAKFPKGDWVVPQVWLKPVKDIYGKGYMSGRIVVVSSRGNANLQGPEGNDLSAAILETGLKVSNNPFANVASKTADVPGSEPWYTAFHNYSLTWTPDTVLFYVDGNVVSGLVTVYNWLGKPLLQDMGIKKDLHWSRGSILAPFDQDFYLCIGLSVGGVRSFPDDSVSRGIVKPWKNNEIKSRLNFYLSKKDWEPTWSEETRFEIDHIKVNAY